MNQYLVYSVGFLAQILFSARLLIQWISSERAGKVMSPLIFWQFSLIASILMIVYGILRHDLAIILGQAITYGVYIRNLHFLRFWQKIPSLVRIVALTFPLLAILWLLTGETYNFKNIVGNKDIPFTLMVWGLTGQFVFTFRFIIQWFYTEKVEESVLPIGFWIFSIIGSVMVLSYAVIRKDPVLFVGQLFGFVVYFRNTLLWMRERRIVKKS
ncbi:MAG: lauroyl acyltransferase [Desulfobacterales bacterium GWB2_56_26]|nr:MAG: lauroyl acyltransferase [Desulfobacterales bacterium GWB2_56_26]